jgi:hypothetical protein
MEIFKGVSENFSLKSRLWEDQWENFNTFNEREICGVSIKSTPSHKKSKKDCLAGQSQFHQISERL